MAPGPENRPGRPKSRKNLRRSRISEDRRKVDEPSRRRAPEAGSRGACPAASSRKKHKNALLIGVLPRRPAATLLSRFDALLFFLLDSMRHDAHRLDEIAEDTCEILNDRGSLLKNDTPRLIVIR